MQKVVGFFSKPENLFVLTLLIGLFTGTYKVVSKASNHNNCQSTASRRRESHESTTVRKRMRCKSLLTTGAVFFVSYRSSKKKWNSFSVYLRAKRMR